MAGDDAPQADEVGPHGRRREHRRLGHDRLAGEERARPQRPRGPVGRQLSRLLREREHDRRPPGAEGGLAPGPGDEPLHGRRQLPQRSLHARRQLRLLPLLSAPGPRAEAARFGDGPLRLRHTRRLRLHAAPGAARRDPPPPRRQPVLRRPPRAHDLRRVLEGPQHRGASEEHQARRAHRRRLVRRRGPGRAAPHLPDDRADEPGGVERHRDGALVARGLGARRRRAPGQSRLRQPDGGVVPRGRGVRLLRPPPEGRGDRGGRRGDDVPDGNQRVAPLRRVAAAGGHEAGLLLRRGTAGFRPSRLAGARPSTST